MSCQLKGRLSLRTKNPSLRSLEPTTVRLVGSIPAVPWSVDESTVHTSVLRNRQPKRHIVHWPTIHWSKTIGFWFTIRTDGWSWTLVQDQQPSEWTILLSGYTFRTNRWSFIGHRQPSVSWPRECGHRLVRNCRNPSVSCIFLLHGIKNSWIVDQRSTVHHGQV